MCEYSERYLWCELLSVTYTHTPTPTHSHAPTHPHTLTHTHTHTHTLTHHHEALWVRSNRNPWDLKMTDVQRQVETASSPSQTRRRQQSLMSNSEGTIITRAHYHNKPSTPTHILTHERLVSTSPAGSGRTVGVDDVPECATSTLLPPALV